ncbi:hypothetical protein T10_4663 [Trichinella papuae]|uniref:Uncharacterized protein n=1 Tax=Trichinella papuae TaxID=268474 RepID=A0A0V1MQS3_9BILA|nr:hypothetical protein T10_4663 [Trichinella papuae]
MGPAKPTPTYTKARLFCSFWWQVAHLLPEWSPSRLTTSLTALRPFVIQNLLVAACVWFTPACNCFTVSQLHHCITMREQLSESQTTIHTPDSILIQAGIELLEILTAVAPWSIRAHLDLPDPSLLHLRRLSQGQAKGLSSQLHWQSCVGDEPQAPRSDPYQLSIAAVARNLHDRPKVEIHRGGQDRGPFQPSISAFSGLFPWLIFKFGHALSSSWRHLGPECYKLPAANLERGHPLLVKSGRLSCVGQCRHQSGGVIPWISRTRFAKNGLHRCASLRIQHRTTELSLQQKQLLISKSASRLT